MKKLIKILLYLIIGFGLIQLIPVNTENPKVNINDNFTQIEKTPPHIEEILKNACYDCHSNETKYPYYAHIAPVSWTISDHISKGRKYMNLSIWGTYNSDQKKGILTHSAETVKNGAMPIAGYMAQHPKARLTKEQRAELEVYFNEILKKHSKS